MSPRRARLFLWSATLAWALLILALGFLPSGDHGGVSVPAGGWDKVGHLVVYGILAALLSLSLRAQGLAPLAGAALAVTLAVAYGVLDEWHQSFTPGRVPSRWDLLADGVGALLAALAVALIVRRRITGGHDQEEENPPHE